jgi:3-methyladenine DNA glycosylase AlkD
MSIGLLVQEIHSLANPARATISQRFFKTGKWEYGEWDVFLGLTVPQTRTLVKKYMQDAPLWKGGEKKNKIGGLWLDDIDTLLADKHHEIRLAGVLSLVHHARDTSLLPEIVERYLTARPGVNNWDLVDTSAPDIVGAYMEKYLDYDEQLVFVEDFIQSKNLWVNRIIVLASFYQIKLWNAKLTIHIAERMLTHKHDLIHKATGWMLREVGKRCSMDELRQFLDTYSTEMPRTMLRYAIEKMDKIERMSYLKKKS